MKDLSRKSVQNIKPYEPGKPMEELQRELGIKSIIKLASNENPIGPSPKAIKAMVKSVYDVNRYPDGASFYLRKKIAKKEKLSIDNIIAGCGSDELIDMIIKAFLEDDDEVLITKPAFLEYSILSQVRGVNLNIVNVENFTYDIDRIINAINKKTKVIFLGNPDNPTGAYLTKDMLSKLLKKCNKNQILVIDEAYRELVDVKDYADPSKFINKKNVIVLRTFSKAYGLAGLRVGYALGSKSLIAPLGKIRLPFNVNSVAQKGACAALDDTAHLRKTKAIIKKGRKFLVDSLTEMGFGIVTSPANFILVNSGSRSATSIFKSLLVHGVIIRDMKAYSLPNYFRVNVGTEKENKRFISTLKKVTS